MNYRSTRTASLACHLSEAIVQGPAPDGGLWVPTRIPSIDAQTLPCDAGDAVLTEHLLAPFFANDPLLPHLGWICAHTFRFDIPCVPLAGDHTHVLELFHGPTAAFKDVGARFLAACLQKIQETNGESAQPVTVLVATSGDTGSAVAAAFDGMHAIQVRILYPDGRVSPRQAHQLGCFSSNVRAYRVQGSFDDCQRMVKQAFADPQLRQALRLVSANSINLGRLLPQMSYYAAAATRHWRRQGTLLNFSVPTGNLGNAFAALLARATGLPLGEVILATNRNRVLDRYLDSGRYQPGPSIATLANAMDVGDPSNVERLNWLFPDHARRQAAVRAVWCDDARIERHIREGTARYGRTWCPHTACAVEVLEQRRAQGDSRPWCVVATAHAAKFEGIVEPLIGQPVPVPPGLAAMLARPARSERLAADAGALKSVLLETVHAAA